MLKLSPIVKSNKACVDCGNVELARRGTGFRNRCQRCQNIKQKQNYHANRETYTQTRQAIYQRHASKRRQEASDTKLANRERYSLLEWFRRQGVRRSDIPTEDFEALVEMKKALTLSKL